MMSVHKSIYTIGHSTRTLQHFIAMLQSFNIEVLVDIRSYPGSKRYPHFNKENLEILLPEKSISYIHLKSLGGRKATKPIQKIRDGGILHFGVMQIIWKQMNLKKVLNN